MLWLFSEPMRTIYIRILYRMNKSTNQVRAHNHVYPNTRTPERTHVQTFTQPHMHERKQKQLIMQATIGHFAYCYITYMQHVWHNMTIMLVNYVIFILHEFLSYVASR